LEHQTWKLPCQPRLIFVGEGSLIGQLQVLDKTMIFEDNPMEALEVAFNLFQGLNVEYPIQSEQVWKLISVLVFGMDRKNLGMNSSTAAILNKIINA
jgi:hypothetical protein